VVDRQLHDDVELDPVAIGEPASVRAGTERKHALESGILELPIDLDHAFVATAASEQPEAEQSEEAEARSDHGIASEGGSATGPLAATAGARKKRW